MSVSEEKRLWFVSSCDLAFQDEVRNWVMLMFMVLEGCKKQYGVYSEL